MHLGNFRETPEGVEVDAVQFVCSQIQYNEILEIS